MDQDDGSARQAWRRERVLTLADFTRSITLVETISRVENDLAETLRVMAARDGDETAARRLRLAETAARAAQAAARASERLRRQARRLAEHTEVVTLHQVLDHAAEVLANLDRAESDLADILTALASYSGPDLAVRWRQLAAEASAAARHARDRVHALHQLARTEAAETQPEAIPAADTADGPALSMPSRHQRLADIDRRLAELRQAGLGLAGGDSAPQAVEDAQRRAREANRLWQESVAHLRQTRQLTEAALHRAATAHDHAAGADERSALAGIGDVAEHKRRAALHRAAARADRQRAQEMHGQAAGPEPAG